MLQIIFFILIERGQNMTKSPLVAVIMGSNSDLPKLDPCLHILTQFEIPHDVRVMSAHRTPDIVAEFAKTAEEKGIQVIIAAAGCAAHLAGVVAAHTILPVIGVPIVGSATAGLDSLLSMVQMPAGVPVACVAAGGGGPANAALLAIQIISRAQPELVEKLKKYRMSLQEEVIRKDIQLQYQREQNNTEKNTATES